MSFKYLLPIIFIVVSVGLLFMEWMGFLLVNRYISTTLLLLYIYLSLLFLGIFYLKKNKNIQEALRPFFKYIFYIFVAIAFFAAPELKFLNILPFIDNYYFFGLLLMVTAGFFICVVEPYLPKTFTSEINVQGFKSSTHNNTNNKKWNRLYLLSTIAIISIGAFLRFWNLGKLGIVWDEQMSWIASEAILQKFIPRVSTGLLFIEGFFYNYINSLIILFLGFSEFSIRILSVLSFFILLFYSVKILKLLKTGRLEILVFMFFISIHYWAVEMSRWGRFYMFEISLTAASLYYLLFYLNSKKKYNLIISVILAMLAVGDHPGYIVLFYIPIYFLAKYKFDWKGLFLNWRNELENIISFFWIILIYLIFNFLRINQFKSIMKIAIKNTYQINHLFLRLNWFKFLLDNPLAIGVRFIYLTPFLFLGLFLFLSKKINLKEKVVFGTSTALFASILIIKLFSDGRFYFIAFIYFSLIIFLTLKYLPNKFRHFVLTYLLVIAILSGGWQLPLIDYASKVNPDYMPAAAIDFYPDNKEPVLVLDKIIKENDVIIFFGSVLRSYPYMRNINMEQVYEVGKPPKKIIFLKNRWLNYRYLDSYEKIHKIIDDSNGSVYVVLTLSSLAFSPPFLPKWYSDLLKEYKSEALYESADGVSKLLKIIR